MPYYYRQVQFGPRGISPAIKSLVIANAAVFLVQSFAARFTGHGGALEYYLGMRPELFLKHFFLWQPATYMFLHVGLWHAFLNMFFLWMFGTEVEQKMGTRTFTILYFTCGIGAGLASCLMFGLWNVSTFGASGAIFGVLTAFGLMFPDRMILLFFVFPVKAYYFVIGMIAIELYMLIFSVGGGVSYISHVSGAAMAWLYLRYEGRAAGFFDGYTKKTREIREHIESAERESEQRRVDEILDKINAQGVHKLTRAERAFLRRRAGERKK